MAPVEVQNTSVSVTPYLRTPEDDRPLAAAGYGAVPLPTTVAARAIEKARSYCTGRAAACSSDEELVASFKELVGANWLKVKGHLDHIRHKGQGGEQEVEGFSEIFEIKNGFRTAGEEEIRKENIEG